MYKYLLSLSYGLWMILSPSVYGGTIPPALLFLNQPVDALCFFNLEHSVALIDLSHCGISKEKLGAVSQNKALVQRGFIGFDWQGTGVPSSSRGYSYYKAFDAGHQQYWLYTINNSGGNGEFTAISVVKRKTNDTMMLKTIVGGDRCNSGVQDVHEKNHRLSFSVNLTSYDFLSLANNNPHHLKAYDDLSACAACCVGKAFYEVDLRSLKPLLNYVEVDEHALKSSNLPVQGVYQTCFNKALISFQSKKGSKLLPQQLQGFIAHFNDRCVSKTSH